MAWWEALTPAQAVVLCFALAAATVILVVQIRSDD